MLHKKNNIMKFPYAILMQTTLKNIFSAFILKVYPKIRELFVKMFPVRRRWTRMNSVWVLDTLFSEIRQCYNNLNSSVHFVVFFLATLKLLSSVHDYRDVQKFDDSFEIDLFVWLFCVKFMMEVYEKFNQIIHLQITIKPMESALFVQFMSDKLSHYNNLQNLLK